MIKVFDFKDFNHASAFFDVTKLEWLNGEYIRRMSDEELEIRLDEYLVDHPAKGKLKPLIPLVKERIKKLADFILLTDFFFEKVEYDISVFQKLQIKNQNEAITKVLEKLKGLQKPWDSNNFEQTFRKLAEQLKISVTQMFQLIRISISGQTVTPPLFESIKILGEEETIQRINDALVFLRSARIR